MSKNCDMKRVIIQLMFGAFGGCLAFLALGTWEQGLAENECAAPARQVIFEQGSMRSFAAAAERSKPAVVHIRAEESEALALQRRERERRQNPFFDFFQQGGDPFRGFFGEPFYKKSGSGSGVIISSDGYIVTNNHVVAFADKITVTLHDERRFSAEVVGRDPSTDLAVLRIDAADLPVLPLANSDEARVGDWVLAVGNPFDYLTSTVTAGIISAKGRNINIIEGEKAIEEFIQTDAVINPGNSGGALVDDQGRLVGINTAIATPTGVYAGYSFAIPSRLMLRIVNEIIEQGGDIHRVKLGIELAEMDREIVKSLGISYREGLLVVSLERQSPARYAGLLPNDVIVSVNDKMVKNFKDFEEETKYLKTGDQLKLGVYRKSKLTEININL